MSPHEALTTHAPVTTATGQLVRPVAVLPGVLRDFGIDPAEVLVACGLPPDALDDPAGRIPFDAVGTLLDCSARRTGCGHIGLVVGERLGLASMAAVGELGRSAATVNDALEALTVYHHVNSPGALAFYGAEGGHVTFAVTAYNRSTLGIDHFYDAVALMLFNIVRELTTPEWRPEVVMLSRSRPHDLAPYRAAFPVQIQFDAEYTGLGFPAEVLQRRVPTANAERHAEVESRLAGIGQHGLVNGLRRALRAELIRGHPSADRVCYVLAMHQRTLHRRLTAAGTSFQQVLDEVRYDAARHYLELTDMPLVEVAAALGYSELSAFTRAFGRWAGVTPGAYRQRRNAAGRTRADA